MGQTREEDEGDPDVPVGLTEEDGHPQHDSDGKSCYVAGVSSEDGVGNVAAVELTCRQEVEAGDQETDKASPSNGVHDYADIGSVGVQKLDQS